MIRFKKLFCSLDGECFYFVGIFLSAIISSSGEAFGVFVGEDGSLSFENGFGLVIFAGNEFHAFVLSALFLFDDVMDLRVGIFHEGED